MSWSDIHIVTGERIQEIADVYLGELEDFRFNPRIWAHTHKHKPISSIVDEYDNPGIVFVYGHRLREFQKCMHMLRNPFTLISHNSDENIINCPEFIAICESPLVKSWFAQNVCFNHEKLKPVPIGIANTMWPHGRPEWFQNKKMSKPNNVYFSFNPGTNGSKRSECYNALKDKIEFLPTIGAKENIDRLSTYKFCICPEGNGADTHRLWEAIYTRTIPVVLSSPFISALKKHTNISMIIVDNWNKFDINSLQYTSEGTYLHDVSLESYKRQIVNHLGVTIVLVCLVNFQEYILDSIQNLITHGNKRIVVLTEYKFFSRFSEFPSVELVDVASLHDEFNFDSTSKLDKSFKDGFWHLASARFFVLYAYLKTFNINRCVHIENDVLVYADVDTIQWNPARMSGAYDGSGRMIPSVVWIPAHNLLRDVLANYNHSINDMYNFGSRDLERLPIFPDNWTLGSHPFTAPFNEISQNYPYYGYVFDAAAIGQYLDGLDPSVHSHTQKKTYVSPDCIIKYNGYRILWKKGCPYIQISGNDYPIFNLHIHSKNLKEYLTSPSRWLGCLNGKYKWISEYKVTTWMPGGLGNQLFALASLHHITNKTGRTPCLSTLTNPSDHTHISYMNTIFSKWKTLEVAQLNNLKHECEKSAIYVSDWDTVLRGHQSVCIPGYLHGYKYVEPDFIETLTLPTINLEKYPNIHKSVFIHIRGGDYIHNAQFNLDLTNYYKRAIQLFPNQSFMVFTNDKDLVASLTWLNSISYELVNEDEITTLAMMSKCAGGICANSTFSWWGAYLNPNRPLVVPSKWCTDLFEHPIGLYFPGVQICEVE